MDRPFPQSARVESSWDGLRPSPGLSANRTKNLNRRTEPDVRAGGGDAGRVSARSCAQFHTAVSQRGSGPRVELITTEERVLASQAAPGLIVFSVPSRAWRPFRRGTSRRVR